MKAPHRALSDGAGEAAIFGAVAGGIAVGLALRALELSDVAGWVAALLGAVL